MRINWSSISKLNVVVGVFLLVGVFANCASSTSKTKCAKNDDCAYGYLCDGENKCVQSDTPNTPDLAFVTQAVKTAIIGGDYTDPPQQFIEVQGGLSPKRWELKNKDANLNWLEIDTNSGLLRNNQGETPKIVTSSAQFDVDVTDSSNVGNGLTISKTYTMVINQCSGDEVPCYGNNGTDPVCYTGNIKCVNGLFSGKCILSTNMSFEYNNCGENCATSGCDPFRILDDNCVSGQCVCGTNPGCSPSDAKNHCCSGQCVDITNDPTNVSNCGGCGQVCTFKNSGCCNGKCVDLGSDSRHCGDCAYDCTVFNNASSSTCVNAVCNYICDNGWGDCDGDLIGKTNYNPSSTGCEGDLINLNPSSPYTGHCGVCEIGTNETNNCLSKTCDSTLGTCTCSNDTPNKIGCPNANSGGNYVCSDLGVCICPPYSTTSLSCPIGQYCCLKLGGVIGCCTKDCDTKITDGNQCSVHQ